MNEVSMVNPNTQVPDVCLSQMTDAIHFFKLESHESKPVNRHFSRLGYWVPYDTGHGYSGLGLHPKGWVPRRRRDGRIPLQGEGVATELWVDLDTWMDLGYDLEMWYSQS